MCPSIQQITFLITIKNVCNFFGLFSHVLKAPVGTWKVERKSPHAKRS